MTTRHLYKKFTECKNSLAARISHRLRKKFGLTYATMRNLESVVEDIVDSMLRFEIYV